MSMQCISTIYFLLQPLSWTNYLKNYLKDITPEACRFTYMTLCIGAWDFGWVWHFGILAIWSRYTRTLLCIHLYIINSVTSSFLMILVTATHGEQWSKLHIEIEIISKKKKTNADKKRDRERWFIIREGSLKMQHIPQNKWWLM